MTFDHIPTAEELLAEYQQNDDQNPASINYKRQIIRPKINVLRAILCCLAAIGSSAVLGTILYFIFENLTISIISATALLLLIVIIFAKQILIWLVRVYQRLAPTKVRERCRFEPSCSEYMILSLQKYGFFHGLKKGLSRWSRCKPPNGGYDPP